MIEPNLFIAGAPKAGTTFLYHVLKDHPDLYFPRIKELNYFSNKNLTELGSYYKDYRIDDYQKYLSQFKDGVNCKYRVDSSVSYFTFPKVAKTIHETIPSAKVIFILRNPIARAFSHYNMDVRMGYADKPFTTYITSQENYPVHYHQYVENGFYFKNINSYLSLFGENIHVLILENIKEDMSALFKFLEIEEVEIDTETKFNKNKQARNFIAKTLQRNRKLASNLKRLIPAGAAAKLNRHLYKDEAKKILTEKDRALLTEIYRNDIKQLGKLLNKDLEALWIP